MKNTDLSWGFRRDDVPLVAEAMWGARGIVEARDRAHPYLDLLHDRMDLRADNDAARAALVAALDGKNFDGALAKFKAFAAKEMKAYQIDGASDLVRTADFDGVRFVFSTNGSHGYLYVTAFLPKAGGAA